MHGLIYYTKWFEQLSRKLEDFEQLMQLFQRLLLQTNGDVSEALTWMTRLNERYGYTDDLGSFIDKLKEEGIINDENGVLILTQKGNRSIRQSAFDYIFSNLKKKGFGNHTTPTSGKGIERLPETRSYTFGDSIENLEAVQSISNAMRHSGIDKIRLSEDDLEVFETEHLSRCATVILIDISHSMVLYGEDRITPAKNVALALSEYILREYDKDSINIIAFGDDAREIKISDLPYLSVGPFHTNTKAALKLARQILSRKKHDNKQIFLITDGKPSCIWQGLKLYKNPYGLDSKIVNQTLQEAQLCRKQKIEITTFMVSADPYLQGFVKELTKINKGRAYLTGLRHLDEYIFIDFIRNRRRIIR